MNKKELINIALIQCPNGFTKKELSSWSSQRIINALDEINPSWRLFPLHSKKLEQSEYKPIKPTCEKSAGGHHYYLTEHYPNKQIQNRKIYKRKIFMTTLLLALFAFICRMLPHPDNFTPYAALFLTFGFFDRRNEHLLVLMSSLLIGDIIFGLHSTMIYVYSSFLLTWLLGSLCKSSSGLLSMSLFSSVMFFILTNFGYWVSIGSPFGVAGLGAAYVSGIPFFKNQLLGDLFYFCIFYSCLIIHNVDFKRVKV